MLVQNMENYNIIIGKTIVFCSEIFLGQIPSESHTLYECIKY